MKYLTILIVSILPSVSLIGQIDDIQIEKKVAALEDSVKIKIKQYGEKHEEVVNAYFNLYDILLNQAKLEQAFKIGEKCLLICLEIFDKKHPSIVKSYNNFGKVCRFKGDYPNALENYKKALAIRLNTFGEMDSLTAKYYHNIGTVFRVKGDYPKALKNYQKALSIQLEILDEKDSSIANSFNDIGLVYYYTGDYSKALENYQKALINNQDEFAEKHPLAARVFNRIGLVYIETGNYTKALENYKKSLAVKLEIFGEKHPSTARTFHNIGEVFTKTDNNTKALENLQKALVIYLEILGEKHPSTANSFNNIGTVYSGNGEYGKAMENYQKALNIWLEKLGDKHPYTAHPLVNIGLMNYKIGEYSEALKNFQIALAIRLETLGERHPSLISTQISLAKTFEALTCFNTADSLWNIIIPNMEDQLSKNYLFLTADKKILYLKTIEKTLTSFYNFISKHGSEQSKLLAANMLINTKSQILDYAISTRQLVENINDENLDSIAFQLNIINRKVAKAELLSNDELAEKGWSLDTLGLQQDELASQILEHPELKAKLNPAKFSWQQIQEKLQANEALIDYFTFYDKIDSAWVFQAMLLKKEEAKPTFIPLSLTKPVVDLLRTKGHFPIYLQYKEARQEMYAHIWKALEPHLENIKIIHLTPVASLNKIDFGSLQNEEGHYLADLYGFHYYTSSKDFYKQKQDKQIYKDANLYGHIAYYKDDAELYEAEEDSFALRLHRDTLVALPATLPEVKAIEKICTSHKVSPILLTVSEAKEDTIEYFSGNRAPSLMHFATHGAYLQPLLKKEETIEMVTLSGEDRFRTADNPLQRSMLMLSNAGDNWKSSGPNIVTENDGILTALEVTNLDLSNTELVVLSACNSGIGSQHTTEGVFGLPRAFKLAGVDKILVSLWPVEDETTKELMILFYTNLLQHKQEAATALRNATAEMRKRDDRPKKWAGFVLVE